MANARRTTRRSFAASFFGVFSVFFVRASLASSFGADNYLAAFDAIFSFLAGRLSFGLSLFSYRGRRVPS